MIEANSFLEKLNTSDDYDALLLANELSKFNSTHLQNVISSIDEFQEEIYISKLQNQEYVNVWAINEYLTIEIFNIISNKNEVALSLNDRFDCSFNYFKGINEELENYLESQGIEIPKVIEDYVSWVPEIKMGLKLLWGIKDVKGIVGIPDNHRNKIIVAKAVLVISNYGIKALLKLIGAGIANIPGELLGGFAAKHVSELINTEGLVNNLLKLDNEEFFYYKNKQRIDGIGIKLIESRKYIESLEFR